LLSGLHSRDRLPGPPPTHFSSQVFNQETNAIQEVTITKEGSVAERSYTVLYEPAEEGGYVAFVPALPGLVTEGDTYEQTRDRVKEAIEGI
jgi:hypothetical protein